MIGRILAMLTGAGGIPDQLRRAYEALLSAKSDSERLVAESRIRALEIAQANRLATPDNPGVKWAIGMVAVAMCGHAGAVAFVSAFPALGWQVQAMPPVYAEMQQSIILSMFGLAGVGTLARLFRR